MEVTPEFWEVFLVLIQFGAIMAVIVLYFDRLWPFSYTKKHKRGKSGIVVKPEIVVLWVLILVACLPAAVIGLLFEDVFDRLFYNPLCVALALIVFGIGFIVIEMRNKGCRVRITSIDNMDFKTAILIGLFQVQGLYVVFNVLDVYAQFQFVVVSICCHSFSFYCLTVSHL